jgi:hypothetical protein
MILAITRTATGDDGTQGRAVLDSGEEWDTLELPWRGNRHLVSCIPAGTYPAEMTFSPRFSRELYELVGVPDRSEIRVHSGNFAGDASQGLRTDVQGCILIGQETGMLRSRPDGPEQLAVLRSRIALADLHQAAGGQPITVAIVWAAGLNPEAE